jgi:hypothetical protein
LNCESDEYKQAFSIRFIEFAPDSPAQEKKGMLAGQQISVQLPYYFT